MLRIILLVLLFIPKGCEELGFTATCQDPSTLTPQLKKAYQQSVELCKQIGCTVSIRCYQKG